MGSIKCTIKKEAKNEINKYIDSEFITETIKEIVNYINTTNKVKIDLSEFNEDDSESRVNLIDKGHFNVYDYMYVKDFLYELSWEGDYIKELKEDEGYNSFKGGSKYIPRKITEDSPVTYKYVPKDIATVIFDKVSEKMELRKGQLYKDFKGRYTTEYLFNNVRWYERSRDGKVYVDLDLDNLDQNKKSKLEEQIKAEIGNAYKTRWGNPTAVKVMPLDNKLLLDIYTKGCSLLGIENKCQAEVIEADNSVDEVILTEILINNCKDATKYAKGINRLKVKVINSIDSSLNNLIKTKIYKTNAHMKLFLDEAREMIFGYYKTAYLPQFKNQLNGKEDKIKQIIERVAIVENILYNNHIKNNINAPEIDELEETKECISWICLRGLVWTSENIYIKNKVKDEIKDVITDDPIDEFTEARAMKRHFYLHVGDTNTGKTYSSIQKLMDAETGVYLAPLRLLALEIQDKLRSENIPCSLLTGEEEDIITYASHVSSTIEKLQLETKYDLCVIDEAQMIADNQRGWAWTRAIIGVLSPEIHICMASEARDIIIKLIKDCNDTYEIIEHKRDTELIFEDKKFDLSKDIKRGDALVVFGKKKALAVSAELLSKNIKTSIIYGSLPYSTRKKQFERFLDGETDVIVCTDAIGMGVNLPIKRIVFLETRKFDGISFRRLMVPEIKQIAGRAGRRGIYDEGFVTATTDLNMIKSALGAKTNKIEKCFIGIPDSLLEIDIDIVDALKTWSQGKVKGYYEKTDVTRMIFLINRLKALKVKASKADLIKMATIPFEENNKKVQALWEEYCIMYSKGVLNLKRPRLNTVVNTKKQLDELESYYKTLELNYSFGKNFSLAVDNNFIASEKVETANKINELLLNSLLDHERVCIDCGKKLSWDYPSERCRFCKEKIDHLRGDRFKYHIRKRSSNNDYKGKRSRRGFY